MKSNRAKGKSAMSKRIVIVGGVAGGASAAARMRRLDESASIVVLERGPHVSFANCGLPYFIGGEIDAEQKLLLQTPLSLKNRFNLDVRIHSEVVRIDRSNRTLEVRDLAADRTYSEPYDHLVLSTGAAPLKPPIPGIERPGHFTLRNIPDMQAIHQWLRSAGAPQDSRLCGDDGSVIREHGPVIAAEAGIPCEWSNGDRRAVIVGGGYIGLEMAEQLHRRGLHVTIAEALPQVMAPLDVEMAAMLHQELRRQGVDLRLGHPVAAFDSPAADESAKASVVVLKDGSRLPADVVILGLGVRPETKLAREAGLTLGERGGIRVDEHLRTSDPAIFAVGDAVEVKHAITGEWSLIPLAGPANRQGRIAADNIHGGALTYHGTYGTAILRLFNLTAACTGANEKMLRQMGIAYQAAHLHPGSHAGYYPGARPMALKILFDPGNGRLLGAQAVGEDGVDKRIDVLATALAARMTVDDMAELELAYAPPFGSAKDPINLAGMAGQNVIAGRVRFVQWHEVAELDPHATLLLDVRDDVERRRGAIPGSIHIPLNDLRARLDELPRGRTLIAYCHSGQRSYYACRLLSQHGFDCASLTGSYKTWKSAQASPVATGA